jgi:hypothetical protein
MVVVDIVHIICLFIAMWYNIPLSWVSPIFYSYLFLSYGTSKPIKKFKQFQVLALNIRFYFKMKIDNNDNYKWWRTSENDNSQYTKNSHISIFTMWYVILSHNNVNCLRTNIRLEQLIVVIELTLDKFCTEDLKLNFITIPIHHHHSEPFFTKPFVFCLLSTKWLWNPFNEKSNQVV